MADKKRLIGIVRPLENFPCFGFPVFSAGHDLSLQLIDKDDRIAAFTAVEIPNFIIHPQPSNLVRAVGNTGVYAFFSSRVDVTVGSRKSVTQLLLSRQHELEQYPFLLTDIAAFLGDSALLEKAIARGAELLSTAGIPSAQAWYDPIVVSGPNFSDHVVGSEGATQLPKKDRLMHSILAAFLQGTGPDVEVTPRVIAAIRDRYYPWLDSPKVGTILSPLEAWSIAGSMFLNCFRMIGRRSALGAHGGILGIEAFLVSASSVEMESDCPYCPSPA